MKPGSFALEAGFGGLRRPRIDEALREEDRLGRLAELTSASCRHGRGPVAGFQLRFVFDMGSLQTQKNRLAKSLTGP
jgi:hypothetical protein